jgi:hypothetical protein
MIGSLALDSSNSMIPDPIKPYKVRMYVCMYVYDRGIEDLYVGLV